MSASVGVCVRDMLASLCVSTCVCVYVYAGVCASFPDSPSFSAIIQRMTHTLGIVEVDRTVSMSLYLCIVGIGYVCSETKNLYVDRRSPKQQQLKSLRDPK